MPAGVAVVAGVVMEVEKHSGYLRIPAQHGVQVVWETEVAVPAYLLLLLLLSLSLSLSLCAGASDLQVFWEVAVMGRVAVLVVTIGA